MALQAQHTWLQAARTECSSWEGLCAVKCSMMMILSSAFLRKKPLLTFYFSCLWCTGLAEQDILPTILLLSSDHAPKAHVFFVHIPPFPIVHDCSIANVVKREK